MRNIDLPDPGSNSDPLVIERQYGISHDDFFRIFPRVIPTEQPVIKGNAVEVRYANQRRLKIELDPEQTRALGAMRLTQTQLRFVFEGWERARVVEFLLKFERSFQKGGG